MLIMPTQAAPLSCAPGMQGSSFQTLSGTFVHKPVIASGWKPLGCISRRYQGAQETRQVCPPGLWLHTRRTARRAQTSADAVISVKLAGDGPTAEVEAWGGSPVTDRAKSSQITLFTNIMANDSLLIYKLELFSSPAKNEVNIPEGARVKTDSERILPCA